MLWPNAEGNSACSTQILHSQGHKEKIRAFSHQKYHVFFHFGICARIEDSEHRRKPKNLKATGTRATKVAVPKINPIDFAEEEDNFESGCLQCACVGKHKPIRLTWSAQGILHHPSISLALGSPSLPVIVVIVLCANAVSVLRGLRECT